MDLKKLAYDAIKDIDVLKSVDNLYSLINYTSDNKNGDLTLPCFSLSKVLRKSPIDIANTIQASCDSEYFEKVENVNGYLNFFLDKKKIYSLVSNMHIFSKV